MRLPVTLTDDQEGSAALDFAAAARTFWGAFLLMTSD
jgi:hypothetical protein